MNHVLESEEFTSMKLDLDIEDEDGEIKFYARVVNHQNKLLPSVCE